MFYNMLSCEFEFIPLKIIAKIFLIKQRKLFIIGVNVLNTYAMLSIV